MLRSRETVGLLLAASLSVQCHQAARRTVVPPLKATSVELAATSVATSLLADGYEPLARLEPLRFLRYCWDHCRSSVRDYNCVFTKQETIDGELLPEQSTRVRFLQNPFSVDMTFVTNVRDCKRALYVAGQWVDTEGNELAWVKPGGPIVRAFVPKIKQPIHGPRARKASRRTIDQFGFDKSFELIMKYSLSAKAEDKLDLRYVGRSAIGSRPTFVFERRLPYTGQEHPYPDKLLVIHIDQGLLVPSACFSYSDEHRRELLGSYVYTEIQMNPGYTIEDFNPDRIDF